MRYREDAWNRVVAFTATQIPDIAGRRYPRELAGPLYPAGIPIVLEEELERLIREEKASLVVFSYSDVSHVHVMNVASRALAAGADFLLLSVEKTMLKAKVPVVSVCATRTGCGKSPVSRRVAALLKEQGQKVVAIRHPMPYGELVKQKLEEARTYSRQGEFATGSMGPKVEAALKFLERGGRRAIITAPEYIAAAVRGGGNGNMRAGAFGEGEGCGVGVAGKKALCVDFGR